LVNREDPSPYQVPADMRDMRDMGDERFFSPQSPEKRILGGMNKHKNESFDARFED